MTIWEQIILEIQGAYGGMTVGPTMARPDATWPNMGTKANFDAYKRGNKWPYSVGDETDLDHLAGPGEPVGPRPPDRGTPMGSDLHGGPPEPSSTYEKTWQDMHEAMGSPTTIGPFAPFDGPSMRGGRDAKPVKDVNGEPISDEQLDSVVDPKIGPNNMWGGAGTIPGQDRGFAASAQIGSNDPEVMKWKPPEDKKMNLREFFDPEAPPAEEVENPEQTHEKDQTDDEVENKLDRVYGQEDNHEFDDGKESDDDSTQFDANGHLAAPPGSPDEEAAEAAGRAAPGAYDMPHPEPEEGGMGAGIVMMDDEPAGMVDLDVNVGAGPDGDEGEDLPGPEEEGEEGDEKGGMLAAGPESAQDFQLTVEPEAGEMPSLSQMLEPKGDALTPKSGPNDVLAMQKAAQGLVPPQQSSWDEIAIQVGDAVVNLRKTGGQPQMPLPGQPPMMESKKKKRM